MSLRMGRNGKFVQRLLQIGVFDLSHLPQPKYTVIRFWELLRCDEHLWCDLEGVKEKDSGS